MKYQSPKFLSLGVRTPAVTSLFLLVSCAALNAATPGPFYGDGSAGALVISQNTDWTQNPPASTNFQYSSVTVNAAWKIPSHLTIRCQGDFVIAVGASLSVVPPLNFLNNPGIAVGIPGGGNFPGSPGIGVDYMEASQILRPGKYGGSMGVTTTNFSTPYAQTDSLGGGTLLLIVGGNLQVDGSLNAKGGDGGTSYAGSGKPGYGSGGGGGGLLVGAVKGTARGYGTVDVSGGNGGQGLDANGAGVGHDGSGGGGGIAHLISPNAPAVLFVAAGGKAGSSVTPTLYTYPSLGGASGGHGGYYNQDASGNISAADGVTGYPIITTVPEPANLFQ